MTHPAPSAAASRLRLQHLRLSRFLPILDWLPHYRRGDLVGDVMAGAIVAIMLVPQSMAYAMLAGLPPQVGLYASIAPLMLYAIFGSSRTLSVAPVAMVSLMVAAGVSQLAEPGSPQYLELVLALAFLIGLMQIMMGLVRLGFLVNFLSHAVIAGFTNAAALVIAVSQVKHVLGVQIPRSENFFVTVYHLIAALPTTQPLTLGLGVISFGLLVGFNRPLPRLLERLRVSPAWALPISRSGPLVLVVLTTLVVAIARLDTTYGVKVVGDIPQGLPTLQLPIFSAGLWHKLVPTALAISFVGFMESVAVAKSLASKKRQRIDANQELIGLGTANLGAALTGGYPIAGGFSRSVVNFAAGANTGLASIITALWVGAVLLFFTPLFYFLPQAALAAIILVAVLNLLDFNTLGHLWRVDKTDAIALLITFCAVLGFGIEIGILIGFTASIAFHLWRTSQPHIAEVGRVGDSEHFRNVKRHAVQTCDTVLAMRIDESLYFANARYLEEVLLNAIADRPNARSLLLIWSAVNHIDASALETLENLIQGWREAGLAVYLSEVKGPVMDQLDRAHFWETLPRDHVFLSTHDAMTTLSGGAPTPESPANGRDN